MAELRQNTWSLDEWYDQAVAGTTGGYNASLSGSLYLWGTGYYGAIGNNKADGHNPAPSVYILSPTLVPGTWANAIFASNGSNFNGGIKTDGTLWIWGDNNYGQLGQNESNPARRSSPVQIPGTDWKKMSDSPGSNAVSAQGSASAANNTCFAFKTDNSLWGWGSNEEGMLLQSGDDYSGSGSGPGPHKSSPVQIPGTTWKLVAGSSTNNVYAIKTDGTLWSWGNNSNGKLGQNTPSNNGRSSPVQIPGTTWKTVICGGGSDCVLATKTDGTMWGWGSNLRGQMGYDNQSGPNAKYSSPVQISGTTWDRPINAGGDVSVVLKTDGTLWGMGRNERGEIGNNNANSISSPAQVGADTNWKDGAGKQGHTFGLKTDGTLWSWGLGQNGTLGLNESGTEQKSSPTQIPGTWLTVHDWNEGGGGLK